MKRVFIPNRGEIAVRVIRACQRLGIEAVVGHSTADADSLAVRMADASVCIGEARATNSYLSVDRVVSAAIAFGCDAIHPGYGFLSESSALAGACADNGITFVGPAAAVMETMSDKSMARDVAERAGVPVLRGSPPLESLADVDMDGVAFPVLIKAVGGGGGRGIRLAHNPAELAALFEEGSREAKAAFADPRLYLEGYISSARHLEVQILADRHGSVVHLGERECSVQRRHQKVLEEAPAQIDSELRTQICEQAVALTSFIGYEGAGTVEFVYDTEKSVPWFIEMNTRLQVEHGVTELTTEVDIVAEQLRIAQGEVLSFTQSDVTVMGHAIEWRVTAEDPERDFLPLPGRIDTWLPPVMPGVRVDTHCFPGYTIPPYYDSLLAKLMAHGSSRGHAIERLLRAVDRFQVGGVTTTLGFCRDVVSLPDFVDGMVTTRWLEEQMPSLIAAAASATTGEV